MEKSGEKMSCLLSLPDETLLYIFRCLHFKDIIRFVNSCYRYYRYLKHMFLLNFMAISWQRPTTNIKSDMVCVKVTDITE